MDRELVLPPTIQKLADQWGFTPDLELPEGYCCRAFADADRVLRWPMRGEEATSGVTAAIRLAAADGPAVYAVDRSTGTMLMERLLPGTKLKMEASPSATGIEVAISMMRRVRALPGRDLPTLDQMYRRELPDLRELMGSVQDRVFLHGDLHQENILRHGERYRPIDPKGFWGDPHYEPIAFLRNLLDAHDQVDDFPRFLESQVGQFADGLGLERTRILRWLRVDALDWRDDYTADDHRHGFADLISVMLA